MIQLADVYMFSRTGWMVDKLREGLKNKVKPVMHKYKEWPAPPITF